MTAMSARQYRVITQVAAARPAYSPCISAKHQAGYASMCSARQRPAILPGTAKALRSAPVAAAVTIRNPASEPKPIRPFVPVIPRLKGSTAPISATCPSAIFTVACSSRKPREAIAMNRWMPWASSR